jgi:hypothetical protein
METYLRTELVLKALDMALGQRRPGEVIHHSDQGSQYTSLAFGQRCRKAEVRPSMGSVGDCFYNAMCESFFATLKCELLDRRRFKTQIEARMVVFDFIEGWYNPPSPPLRPRLSIANQLRKESSAADFVPQPNTVHTNGLDPVHRVKAPRQLPRVSVRADEVLRNHNVTPSEHNRSISTVLFRVFARYRDCCIKVISALGSQLNPFCYSVRQVRIIALVVSPGLVRNDAAVAPLNADLYRKNSPLLGTQERMHRIPPVLLGQWQRENRASPTTHTPHPFRLMPIFRSYLCI